MPGLSRSSSTRDIHDQDALSESPISSGRQLSSCAAGYSSFHRLKFLSFSVIFPLKYDQNGVWGGAPGAL